MNEEQRVPPAGFGGADGKITAVSASDLKKISDSLVALGYEGLKSGKEASLAARIYKEQDAERADPLVLFGGGGVGAIIGLNAGAVGPIVGAVVLVIVAASLKYLIDRDRRMNSVVAAVVEFRRSDRRELVPGTAASVNSGVSSKPVHTR